MWVVIALGVLVALPALVLSVPVDLGLRAEAHGRLAVGFTIVWLFGRVKKSFQSGGKRDEGARVGAEPAGEKGVEEEKAQKKKRRRPPGRMQIRYIVRIVRTPGLRESLTRLLGRLVRCVRVRSWFADFCVGLGDPCDTALLVGSASAVLMAVPTGDRLRLSPDFEGDLVCEGQAGLDARLVPITLLPPIIAFLFNPSTIRVLVTLVQWKLARK